ncbi:transcriptional regulator MdrR2 [Sessilibacter sp. MAH1]
MTIWQPNLEKYSSPKYKALAQAIDDAIAKGELRPGEKLPTHRKLADLLGVTVGTVTRAYAEAERKHLIESKIGSGTFVRTTGSGTSFEISHAEQGVIDLGFSFALPLNQAELLSQELQLLSQDKKILQHILEYQPPGGMLHHREAGLQWLDITGIQSAEMERLIITNGGQHGFHSATAALCQAGDTALSCGLTYPGFSAVAQQLGLRHVGLEWDDQGVLPEAVKLACQRFKPRILYVNTRINNPTCEVMTEARIDSIAEILREHQVWVIEDDVQGCLQDKTLPTFTNRHPDISVFVTGTSKALTGGLRIGYLLAPQAVDRAIRSAVQASCWMAAPMMAEIVSRWITNGTAQNIINSQRDIMDKRQKLVGEFLKDSSFKAAEKGYNVWLPLPETRRAQEFTKSLANRKVLVKPSTAFAAGHFNAPQAIRFCTGGHTSLADLRTALEIISDELKQPGPELDFSH